MSALGTDVIDTLENPEYEPEAIEHFSAVQRAINSGIAWRFQGSYGRGMMDSIQLGACMLGKDPCLDYWGNRIPSRDEVKEGTPGSYEYVVDQMGEEWANTLRDL